MCAGKSTLTDSLVAAAGIMAVEQGQKAARLHVNSRDPPPPRRLSRRHPPPSPAQVSPCVWYVRQAGRQAGFPRPVSFASALPH
eukprot:355278-Chlamydomonas_euryale.AAC.1